MLNLHQLSGAAKLWTLAVQFGRCPLPKLPASCVAPRCMFVSVASSHPLDSHICFRRFIQAVLLRLPQTKIAQDFAIGVVTSLLRGEGECRAAPVAEQVLAFCSAAVAIGHHPCSACDKLQSQAWWDHVHLTPSPMIPMGLHVPSGSPACCRRVTLAFGPT